MKINDEIKYILLCKKTLFNFSEEVTSTLLNTITIEVIVRIKMRNQLTEICDMVELRTLIWTSTSLPPLKIQCSAVYGPAMVGRSMNKG